MYIVQQMWRTSCAVSKRATTSTAVAILLISSSTEKRMASLRSRFGGPSGEPRTNWSAPLHTTPTTTNVRLQPG